MLRFKYYQDGPADLGFPLAYYRDSTNEILKGSDVSAETLKSEGIPVPKTPGYEAWRFMTLTKRRCGACWAALRGSVEDLANHRRMKHLLGQPGGIR